MWNDPYIINRVLEKGAYEFIDYDGIPLGEPQNGFYLKRDYTMLTKIFMCTLYILFIECILKWLKLLFFCV